MAHFDTYAAMLAEWQSRMNLVGPATLNDIWGRHFGDSAQLLALDPAPDQPWLDVGSGAGFPALVLALLGRSNLYLVEATGKKCRFLEAVADALDLRSSVKIHQARIEALPEFAAGVISARACAPLVRLFDWGLRFATRGTRWVLLKGQTAEREIEAARSRFAFEPVATPSRSDPRGVVLSISHVRRR